MSIVKFKEDTHQYFSGDRELISVSALFKKFQKEKDWKAIASKKSNKLKKEGIIISSQDLLKDWERKRNLGTAAGTIMHKIKEEEYLKDTNLDVVPSLFEGEFKYSIPLLDIQNNTTYPELMIHDLEFGVCGQSDLVEITNNYINIKDYKSDKSIDFRAFTNDFIKPEKLLPPLSHLDNCSGNIYSLKMSCYMYMLWKATKGKFKPGKITIIWCPIERDGDGIPVLYEGIPKILREEHIEVPYRKKEVMDVLKTLKNGIG